MWNADTRASVDQFNQWFMKFAPKAPLLAALNNHPELAEQVFKALHRITRSQLLSERRVYGGGLHKLEELAQIPAREVLDASDGQVHIEQQERQLA